MFFHWMLILSICVSAGISSAYAGASFAHLSFHERGLRLKRRGSYNAARRVFRQALAKNPCDYSALLDLASLYRARGRSERELEYLDKAAKAAPGNPEVLNQQGLYRLRRGGYRDAERLFLEAVKKEAGLWPAWINLARARYMLGDRKGRRLAFEAVVDAFNKKPRNDYISLVAAGTAASACGDRQGGLDLLARACAMSDEIPVEALIRSGELFLETHQPGDASREFQKAVRLNRKSSRAMLGLARCAFIAKKYSEAELKAERAAAIDPLYVEAYVLMARVALLSNDLSRALTCLSIARRTDASHPGVIALSACERWMANDAEAVERMIKVRAATAPRDASVLYELGRLNVLQRRNVEAELFLRRALKVDPYDSRVYRELGCLLFRDGREGEASTLLERAYKIDPYLVPVVNFLKVLDYMAGDFIWATPAPGIILKVEARRDAFWMKSCGKAVAELAQKYRKEYEFVHDRPLVIEVFPEQRWLSARAVGLPYAPLLGVCFGRVVVVDSPVSVGRAGKDFCWKRILAHEMSHAFTLAKTHGRIPRWLTEGLAQFDEDCERPASWARAFRLFCELKELLPVSKLDRGFLSPRSSQEIPSAYFESLEVVRLLYKRFGRDGINRMLTALADGDTTAEHVLEVLGDRVQLERWILDELYRKGRRLRVLPAPAVEELVLARAARKRDNPGPGELDLVVPPADPFAVGVPDDRLLVLEALVAFEKGRTERARSLLKPLVKKPQPDGLAYDLAAAILERVGKSMGAVKYWKKALDKDPDDTMALTGLAVEAQKHGDEDNAVDFLRRAVRTGFPLLLPNRLLCDILLKKGCLAQADSVARSFCDASRDEFDLRCDFGRRALASGDFDRAFEWLSAAYEIRPQDIGLNKMLIEVCEGRHDTERAMAFRKSLYGIEISRGRFPLAELWKRASSDDGNALAFICALEWQSGLKGRENVLKQALACSCGRVSFEAARQLAFAGDACSVRHLLSKLSDPRYAKAAGRALECVTMVSFNTDQQAWEHWFSAHKGQSARRWRFEAFAEFGYDLEKAGPDDFCGMCILALDEKPWFVRHNAHLLLQHRSGLTAYRNVFCLPGENASVDELQNAARSFWKDWLKNNLNSMAEQGRQ